MTRRLPNSDASRKLATDKAFANYASIVNPIDIAISNYCANLLNGTVGPPPVLGYKALLAIQHNDRQIAIDARIAQHSAMLIPRKDAQIWLRHLVQSFDMACERGEAGFNQANRSAYGLDVSNQQIPLLNTDDELLEWGPKFLNGEANRVAAGGSPVLFPALADVTTRFNAWSAAKTLLNQTEFNANAAQEVISGWRPQLNSFIKRMWDEIEAFNSQDPDASSRRAKAAAWGVKYVTPGEVIILEGIVNSNSIGEVGETPDITPTSDLEITLKNSTPEITGPALIYYFSTGPGLPPTDPSKTRTLIPGGTLKIKLHDIGFDEDNGVTTLLVQNLTANAGSYSITVVVE